MNFKRNLFVITTALVGALSLSGCDFKGLSNFKHFDFIEAVEDKHETIENVGNTKIGNYESYKVNNPEVGEKTLGSAYEVFRDYGGASHIPSEGKQKIIVVPVEFSDYTTSKLNLTNEQYIDLLNKAFFGCSLNNAYVSVGEYFNKSSYGKLSLDGKVCDKVYTFPLSVSQIKERKLSREQLAEIYYPKVIDWYKANYNDIADYEIEGLKKNNNVPIYMVYTYPSESSTSGEETFFWAYTFDKIPLSWSSSSFMYLQYGEPDAHTFIHETGHLLGLTDYYPTIDIANTDKKSGNKTGKTNEEDPASEEEEKPLVTPEPTGRIDMMDCSIGDETSFSKMMLNWTRPIYVYDSCEVTINSFVESGDVVLLANNWNKTVFDEYYLFEYYTPTGLNTYDVSVGNSEAKLPKIPGIKIYHVDSRLAYVNAIKDPKEYCENGSQLPSSNNVGLAHNNNTYLKPTNEFQKNYLYELILKNESDPKGACANDSNLFRYGDEIPTLKLNRGGEINFKISITYSTFNQIGLKFEKVENSQK